MNVMQQTMKYLCENIQGCVFGYTQSDEITLILIDYQKLTSSAWFDYEVQKLCSIAASMATMAFNKYFLNMIISIDLNLNLDDDEIHIAALKENGFDVDLLLGENRSDEYYDKILNLIETYNDAEIEGAMFDARCFNIPKEEVCNLIYWRQLDATRNSIQMVGQANFSHSELQNKSCNEIQDMLMTQKNINWNDFPVDCKRGAACIKAPKEVNIAGTMDTISTWEIDRNMPILRNEDREYVDKLVYV